MNDDAGTSLAISPLTLTQAEGNTGTTPATTFTFTVTRTGSTATDVNYTLNHITTTAADFTGALSGTVSFTGAETTETITISVVGDTLVEPNEDFSVTLSGATGGATISNATSTGTITNDDTSNVSVAVAPTSVTEDGAGNLVYTFTRTGTSSETPALTIDFTVGGSAGFSTDYTQTGAATFNATTGTVTFLAGLNTATVTVDPSADGAAEPNETVDLTVTAGAGYNVGAPALASGTILNDDAGTSVAISPLTLTQAEGNTGTTPATSFTFTVTRTGSTATDVNYTLNHITTTAADFTGALSGTVSFTGAETTETITISVVGDTLVEPNEDFSVTLSGATGGATISNATSTGTITNDDTSNVSVAVAPASVNEDGAANLVYTFTRTGTSSETPALTIDFSVGGGAGFSGDYTQTGAATFTATTGTVTFLAGSSTATVTVDPTTDPTFEPNETVDLTVVAGTGYNVGAPALASGTILNDDAGAGTSLAISPPNVTQNEGNTGTTPATTFTFTVTRTGSTATDVNYTLNHITTTAADFTGALSGTVSFTGAETTETITISVVGDTFVEPNEDFSVTLSGATGGATIGTATSTGTITNDDTSSVSVAVAPASVTEDGAGNLVYTFTRNNTSSETPALTINFIVGGGASFPSDYEQTGAATFTATTGTVTFPLGINTATVTVDPSPDGTVEPNETVVLTVDTGAGYNIGAPTAATGTILNDDAAPSTTIYVDDSWSGTAPFANPANNPVGPLMFGVNAFSDIPSAIAASSSGGTIVVFGGTYPAAVDINQNLAPFQISVNSTIAGETTVAVNGAVTLTSAASFVATGVGTGGTPANLTFGSTVNSGGAARALSVDMGATRNVTFTGAVGTGGNLASLTIANANIVLFSNTVRTVMGGNVTQLAGAGTTTFAGAGISTIGGDLSLKTGSLAFNAGTLNVGGSGGATLELVGGTATESAATTITGGMLSLKGVGSFTLTSATNDFANFTANTNGAISYRDANSLNVTAAGINTVDDNIQIQTGGALAIGGVVDVDNANLTLIGGGAVTQTAAVKGNLLTISGTGPFTLTNTTNAFTSLTGNTTGAISYTDGSDLSVLALAAAANITVSTHDIAAGTQNLTVAGNISATAGGNILLNAGDNLTIQPGTTVSAAGSLNLNGDLGGAVDAAGSIMTIAGNITAGVAPINIVGNANNDTIQIDSNGGTATDGGTVANVQVAALINGFAGEDTLTLDNTGDATGRSIAVDAVAGTNRYRIEGMNATAGNDFEFLNIDTLNVTAGQGADTFDARFTNTSPAHDLNTATLNGWLGADNFLLFTSNQKGGTGAGLTPTGVASGVTAVNLNGDAPGNPNGGDGNDVFGETPPGYSLPGTPGLAVASTVRLLRPSATTAITVNGGQPTGPAAGDAAGDRINLDLGALPTTTPVFMGTQVTGGLTTLTAAGVASFSYTQIEDLNLVDTGALTNVHVGDFYARGSTGTNTILFQPPTVANPNGSKVSVDQFTGEFLIPGRSVVFGLAGNDTISQAGFVGHAAEFYGDDGDDVIYGGSVADSLFGGIGNDRIYGGAGGDTLTGDAGNDLLAGNADGDTLRGGADHDVLIGGGGNDFIFGDAGNDLLFDGLLNITGGPHLGNDNSQAKDDANDLAMRDLLADWTVNVPFALGQIVTAFTDDHSGTDQLTGGAGDDTFSNGPAGERLDFGNGNDTLLP